VPQLPWQHAKANPPLTFTTMQVRMLVLAHQVEAVLRHIMLQEMSHHPDHPKIAVMDPIIPPDHHPLVPVIHRQA
jgi:hypothetical protein